MPSSYLTKKEKAQCKVILALLVVSLLMEKINDKFNEVDEALPAVSECTQYIDKLLSGLSRDRRNLMVGRIQTIRIRLTKRVKGYNLEVGLLGALRYLTGGTIKAKPATQLAYIIDTFSKNLIEMEKLVPQKEEDVATFAKLMKESIGRL